MTRALTTGGPSRRRIVAGILGAGFAGWRRGAEAACPPDAINSRGRCLCRTTGRPPVDGVCPCPNGQIRCDGICTRPAVGGGCSCLEPCGRICCQPGTSCVSPEICISESSVVSAPTEAVWDALVEPEALAAWGLSNDIAPRVGHRFHLSVVDQVGHEQTIEGEIVEVEPLRRLVFTWSDPAFPKIATVTVALDPLDGGQRTALRISSDGGSVVCRRAARLLGPGWRQTMIGEGLPRYLSGGAPYREIESARSSL
jgi:uncharacterized protein YndB with AHSA1/START domain